MADQLQHKRGIFADIGVLLDGQFGFATDTLQLYMGWSGTNRQVNAYYLPGEATLSGTYYGNVYVNGPAILDGTTVINGDLIITNDISCTSAYAGIQVYGDCMVNLVDLSATTESSNNFVVEGDLTLYAGAFTGAPLGQSVQVGGDLNTGSSTAAAINLTSTLYSPGGTLQVGGNLIAPMGGAFTSTAAGNTTGGSFAVLGSVLGFFPSGAFQVNNHGTNDGTVGTGNGGSISIGGDFYGAGFSSHGGDWTGGNNAESGGAGGNVTIGGSCYATDHLYAYGGAAYGACGSAGTVIIGGSLVCPDIEVTGGSSSNNGAGGSGGSITVRGDLINTGGPLATNAGTSGTGSSSAAGGAISVGGHLLGNPTITTSGNNSTATGAGGAAGNVTVGGNLVAASFTANGGAGVSAVGGAAGNLSVAGNTVITGNVSLTGGATSSSTGGVGGSITCSGSFTCSVNVTSTGGAGSTGTGGAGGVLSFYGFCTVYGTLASNGGLSSSGIAGAGGSIFLYGGTTCGAVSSQFGASGTLSGSSLIVLNGTCAIEQIDLTVQTGSFIQAGTPVGAGSAVATLKVGSFGFTNVLVNASQGSPTSALTAPAANLYSYSNTTAIWYVHTGTAA
jgi:hypothetical protein